MLNQDVSGIKPVMMFSSSPVRFKPRTCREHEEREEHGTLNVDHYIMKQTLDGSTAATV